MKSHEIRENKLRDALKKIPNITENTVEEVVQDAIGNDDFQEAQQELNSGFKREKYVKENFKYILPVEKVFNKHQIYFLTR